VITGLAAPACTSPGCFPPDISTVAEFEEALDVNIDIILGLPFDFSCIVESSAINYAASGSVCTDAFTADQLTRVPFCYSFQTTISSVGGSCDVNLAAQFVIEELEAGGFENVIGPVADIAVQFVPTDSPTEGPTSETDLPTGGTTTEEPTSGTTTEGPTGGTTTEGPTSGTTTEGPTSGGTTIEPTSGGTTIEPTSVVG